MTGSGESLHTSVTVLSDSGVFATKQVCKHCRTERWPCAAAITQGVPPRTGGAQG